MALARAIVFQPPLLLMDEPLSALDLALQPAHSRGHQIVTAIRRLQPFRYLHDCSDRFRLERVAGWASHPLESAAFSRRTPTAVIPTKPTQPKGSTLAEICTGFLRRLTH